MAKPRSDAPSKGKGTLNAFFKKDQAEKKAKHAVSNDTSSDAGDDHALEKESDDGDFQAGGESGEGDEENSDDVEMDEAGVAETTSVDKKASPANSHLPPISSIPAIFTDLVSRISDIKKVTERVKGRKLRVATMCSGTESPLLALDLIQDSIAEVFETRLEIEHVFSCEIEPFKQAYIERNFSPPILFRDICELGDNEA